MIECHHEYSQTLCEAIKVNKIICVEIRSVQWDYLFDHPKEKGRRLGPTMKNVHIHPLNQTKKIKKRQNPIEAR